MHIASLPPLTFFRLYHKCPQHSVYTGTQKGRDQFPNQFYYYTLTCVPTDECSTTASQPRARPEHSNKATPAHEPARRPPPGEPLTTTVSHALEIACASRNANVTTPLGSCVRSAVRTTSGYVPSKNTISRAAGCSASVSVAICSGDGSGKSSGFLRVARQ